MLSTFLFFRLRLTQAQLNTAFQAPIMAVQTAPTEARWRPLLIILSSLCLADHNLPHGEADADWPEFPIPREGVEGNASGCAFCDAACGTLCSKRSRKASRRAGCQRRRWYDPSLEQQAGKILHSHGRVRLSTAVMIEHGLSWLPVGEPDSRLHDSWQIMLYDIDVTMQASASPAASIHTSRSIGVKRAGCSWTWVRERRCSL